MPIRFICLGVMLAAASVSAGLQRPPRVNAPSPTASVISLPPFEIAHAIWGSTGQDSRGHLWFGVTSAGLPVDSAHLMEYVPETNTAIDRGDVVAELKRAGLWRPGERQQKIHSRIVQGPANYLYFCSMDEEGENDDGSQLPTWGGHLWRLNITTNRWEHLLRTPEALIAVGAGGRFVYTLGYFGHVLYQYNTDTGKVGRVVVGSVDGHVSRNFLVDDRGHAYVPRLTRPPSTGGSRWDARVTLVELGRDLVTIRETPVDAAHYLDGEGPTGSHGIIGLQAMNDRSIFFTTHTGFLKRIVPPSAGRNGSMTDAPADIVDVGWIHPEGPSYAASLFTDDGIRHVSSAVRRGAEPWEWVSCDTSTLACAVAPLNVPGIDGALNRAGLYGSSTRDARGGHYLVGILDHHPIVVRIQGGAR